MSEWKEIIERHLGGRSIPIVIIVIIGMLMLGVQRAIRGNVFEIIDLAKMPSLYGVLAVFSVALFIGLIAVMVGVLVWSLMKLAKNGGAAKGNGNGRHTGQPKGNEDENATGKTD